MYKKALENTLFNYVHYALNTRSNLSFHTTSSSKGASLFVSNPKMIQRLILSQWTVGIHSYTKILI